jgi:O-antigen/teichoic acid export membrane protein
LFSTSVLYMDLLLIGYLAPGDQAARHEQAGIYAVAVGLSKLLVVFPSVTGMLVLPHISRLGEFEHRRAVVLKALAVVAIVTIPVAAVLALFAGLIVRLMYGQAFAAAALPLMLLLPGIVIWSLESVWRKLLVSDGYDPRVTVAWGITAAVNIGLNLVMIPRLGGVGAALASSSAWVAMALMTIPITIRKRRIARRTPAADPFVASG